MKWTLMSLALALGGLWAAEAHAVGPAETSLSATPAAKSADNSGGSEPKRFGLWGAGWSLEFPALGVLTGIGQSSATGWGYTLGGSLGYEVTPAVLLRVGVQGGQTHGARATMRYLENVQTGVEGTSRQDARWTYIAAGLGGAYLFGGGEGNAVPFVGADARLRFGGYDFLFNDDVKYLKAVDIGDVLDQCMAATCKTELHDAIGWGFLGSVRAGVRLVLTSYLAAEPELEVGYTRITAEPVSNTVANRDVHVQTEHLFLVRAAFSLRLGL